MDKLKRLREERGLSQVKLAARADLNPATVNQIERGMRDASPGTLRKLAGALDVSLYDLLEEDSPKALALSLEPSFNDVIERQRFSRFAGAIAAAADKYVETMAAPDAEPKIVAGVVDATVILHETVLDLMATKESRQAFTKEEGDEVLDVAKKLLEAARIGVRRIEEAAEDEQREENAKRMRELISQWNRRLSA